LVGENVLSDQTQTTSAGEDLNAKMESVGFGKGYRYYALGLLTVVYVFNFIDRQIVVILQESIK
jgi:hypothetical protein